MKRYAKTSLKAIIFFLALLMPLSFYGQTGRINRFQRYFYVNVNGGITQYYGDLNNFRFYNTQFKPAAGLILGFKINPVYGIRAQLLDGKIASQNNTDKLITTFRDASVDLSINIINLISGSKERMVSCYAFGGGGFASLLPTRSKLNGRMISNESYKASAYQFIAPFGFGAKLALDQKVDFSMEYRNCVVFDDGALDHTKAVKPRDYYGYASIGLTYNFVPNNNMWDLPRKCLFGLFR